jgi:hypothetical protein
VGGRQGRREGGREGENPEVPSSIDKMNTVPEVPSSIDKMNTVWTDRTCSRKRVSIFFWFLFMRVTSTHFPGHTDTTGFAPLKCKGDEAQRMHRLHNTFLPHIRALVGDLQYIETTPPSGTQIKTKSETCVVVSMTAS